MASKPNSARQAQAFDSPLLMLPDSKLDRPLPASSTFHSLLQDDRPLYSSHTWTSTSGDLGLLNDADEVEDRAIFVQEYNRLAKKHGIRPLILDDFGPSKEDDAEKPKRRWFHRMFWSNSSRAPLISKDGDIDKSRHRRSASDLAHLIHSRREAPSVLDLQSMVRLSGKSSLYLPAEYAPCALILPTCIRATAQYVAQHANTRGVFRIPGSMKVVGAIFDYYCHLDKSGADISGTVRSATLPQHIQYSVHDIASTLKRLLSTLPGGILGSLLLLDAFIAIQSQLNAEPEFPRTNQTKVRARLIALAIGTIESQYRRELICAVFGLLSMIGRIAELAPREDESGLPLPTADLMGYGALSICFGPLLVGDLLQSYTMKLATPDSGLIVLPPATQQVRRDTRRARSGSTTKNVQPAVDKILVANRVTEMLISNWRDIVRQMKSLGTHRRRHTSGGSFSTPVLRPSASETFLTKLPKDFVQTRPYSAIVTRNATEDIDYRNSTSSVPQNKQATISKRASSFLRQKASVNTLSPTMEESPQTSRLGNDITIAEETGSEQVLAEKGTDTQSKVKPDSITEGTQTEIGTQIYSPTGKNPLAVPPRLSSVDSKANSSQEINDQIHGNVGNEEGADENLLSVSQAPTRQTHSGESTPPQYYSPIISAANPVYEAPRQQILNEKELENWRASLDHVPRQGAQSPATDPKYQLKRYKRKNHEPLTGSPVKKIDKQRPSKAIADTFGRNSTPRDIGRASRNWPVADKSTPQTSPIKGSPKKLRRVKSGPMRNHPTVGVEDDVFKSPQRAPVGVWRNGVLQKSPTAKVLRSSVSDGVSLRASAIRSLISAGKSRIKGSQAGEGKKPFFQAEDEPNSWAKCSQEGLHVYEQPKSIIHHLNLQHGYSVPPEYDEDSEAAIALYQIIISLHDRLLKQEMEADLHQKGAKNARLDDAGKLRHDVSMWRRRAESAEKRILVFERFTERLKGIRDAAIASEQAEPGGSGSQDGVPAGSLKLDKEFVSAAARVRFAEVDGNGEPGLSPKHEESEIRPSHEGERTEAYSRGSDKQNLDNQSLGNNGETGLRPRQASFDEVAELWMAAKELLDIDKGKDA